MAGTRLSNAVLVAAVVAASSCCSAFNMMAPKAERSASSTRLYDSYEDQYAKFYNRATNPAPVTQEPTPEYDTNQMEEVAEEPAAPAFSYLESVGNAPAAPVVEQKEEVYYEATNSYGAPEPEEIAMPEPVVTMASSIPPPPVISDRPPPLEYDSSPTLSASSPTISVTLPVGLRAPKLEKAKDISYGESSRKFRRTVYSHDDWVRHRDPDRFFRYITSIPTSGIYRNLQREVWAVVGVTLLIMIYNGLITGYQDAAGAFHDPVWSSPFLPPLTLPATPFTLTSPSLGLLLVFRSNTAYQRWDEARKNWGMNINHTRDLNRMANAYYDKTGVSEEQRKADLERLSLCTWAFVRSMKRHLSPEAEDENAFKAELYEKLPKTQAQAIITAAHRPNRALYDLSLAIENLPMHFLRKNEMHAALTIFEDNLGSSERLLTSPVPLIYNRHTARFLSVWLLLLPFALWEPFGNMWNHIGMLPTMAMLGLLLFGIEELATQMEEPFTILPMQAFCDKIGNWCNEIVSWEDGTNGISTNRSYQGRTKVYADTTEYN